jgi:hypothetical protein
VAGDLVVPSEEPRWLAPPTSFDGWATGRCLASTPRSHCSGAATTRGEDVIEQANPRRGTHSRQAGFISGLWAFLAGGFG